VNKRFGMLTLAFAAVWAVLALRVFYVQVLRSPYYRGLSENQSIHRDVLAPSRGEIYDRSGERLVVNVKSRAGVAASLRGSRICPNGPMAGQVLGTVGRDGYGQSGLEFHLDRDLRGTDGWRYLRRDARRRYAPSASDQIQPAVDGLGLRLALDGRVQSVVEHALERGVRRTGAKSGVAIVIEPYTGDILAMANYPFFDPNTPGGSSTEARRNDAVTKVFEPGSTFKIFTAAALLEEKKIRPGDTIDAEGGRWQINGQWIRDTHPYDRISFSDAVAYSSNIVFAKVSTRVSPITFYKYLRSFGFGMKSGVALPAEESGLLKPVGDWSGRTQQTIAFGHEVSATPLQVAMAFAAIANGGVLMRPRLVQGWVDAEGRPVNDEPAREVRRVLSDTTAARLRTMMSAVVDHGTAEAIKHPTIPIAGKTGSAQKIDPATGRYIEGSYNASFVGMAPADRPKFVALVVIDDPQQFKYGGQAAAPVFREILDRLAEREHEWSRNSGGWTRTTRADTLPRHPEKKEKISTTLASFRLKGLSGREEGSDKELRGKIASSEVSARPAQRGEMPDLRDATLRDALRRLRALGVEAEYSGEGRVQDQQPAPGTPLRRGAKARLTLGWAG
jgi:cell division protein FtsI/penicillin-binding protein 2